MTLIQLNIGNLLELKAEAQGLEIVPEAENADESYAIKLVTNTTKVAKLLVD